jgi:hypothetical protein
MIKTDHSITCAKCLWLIYRTVHFFPCKYKYLIQLTLKQKREELFLQEKYWGIIFINYSSAGLGIFV